MVRVKQQFKDPKLKPCPFCNDTVIVVVDMEGAEWFRTLCKCGWSKKIVGWHSTKEDLINDYNELIQEGEILTS